MSYESIFTPPSHPEVDPLEVQQLTSETKDRIVRLAEIKARQGEAVPFAPGAPYSDLTESYVNWLDVFGDDDAFMSVTYVPLTSRYINHSPLVARVVLSDSVDNTRAFRPTLKTEYTVIGTPDGLDIERHDRIEDDFCYGRDMSGMIMQWNAEFEGEQEARERGTARVSEAEGQRLATELFNATELWLGPIR